MEHTVTVVTTNLAQIRTALSSLPPKLQRRGLRAGLNEVAKPTRAALRHNAAVSTGALKRSIGAKQITPRSAAGIRLWTGIGTFVTPRLGLGELGLLVGPTRKINGYAQDFKGALLERGVRAHLIQPRKRNQTGRLRLAGGHFVPYVRHPGIRATRWMTRAERLSGPAADAAFSAGVRRWLDRNA